MDKMIEYKNMFFSEFDIKLLGKLIHGTHTELPAKVAISEQVSGIKKSRGL